MKPKLIILGTNEYQNPLIVRAKELGYETHVYGVPSGQIGERNADVYHPINIMDYEKLWEDCKEIDASGVASIASEVTMHPQNFLLRRLGIPCNGEWTEKVTTDKFLMRQAMKDAGIDSPKFALVTSEKSISNIKEITKSFSYPLIVKPVDLSSSRGVYKINTEIELEEGVNYAMVWSEQKKIIIEEYIDGPEYSGESIAYKGQYKLLAITEKHTTGAPHFVETGHKEPATLSLKMFDKVEQTLYRAFAALKIEYGAIHPEFRITPEGRVMFMEIATRMGGDCIGSDLVPISTGMDFMGMVINVGCGIAPDYTPLWEPRVAEIKYIMNSGDLIEFEKIKKETPSIITRQSEIQPLSNKPILKSADRAGYYITARKR